MERCTAAKSKMADLNGTAGAVLPFSPLRVSLEIELCSDATITLFTVSMDLLEPFCGEPTVPAPFTPRHSSVISTTVISSSVAALKVN